jgi:biopolymer transport protein ExbB
MICVGWTIAARKILYLNSIEKGTKEFIRQWSLLSSDLTAIDHADKGSVKSLGGNADPATQSLIQKSPLYEIYHIGSDEIRHRLANDRTHKKGLTGRSIQAIRAALDAGMVRCQHKLTDGLVYLTISIAGGPYVGLLGTVVGVMITFALIAKSGEVDVNAIAPGIASALLATVAGLVVAIPALFVYSYLNNRIKGMVGEIQVFIDEFVAKMAEFYQGSDNSGPVSKVIE